jgi:hypothetical protein
VTRNPAARCGTGVHERSVGGFAKASDFRNSRGVSPATCCQSPPFENDSLYGPAISSSHVGLSVGQYPADFLPILERFYDDKEIDIGSGACEGAE